MEALRLVDGWPVDQVAVGVARDGGLLATHGQEDRIFRLASVTKLFTAYATLIAAEEGAVELDAPAGPAGSTIRHLLAHASGLPFEGTRPISRVGARRVYSNTGFEVLAAAVAEAVEMRFAEYLGAAVLRPLGLKCELRGSPAAGLWGSLADLLAFALELLSPRLVARETLEEATSVAFPGLGGVLPDFGRMEPNDWGLGFELRDAKSPHWTGVRNSQATFGHFGGSGTFLWVDPQLRAACACLADREFGPWAIELWPLLSDAVVGDLAGG